MTSSGCAHGYCVDVSAWLAGQLCAAVPEAQGAATPPAQWSCPPIRQTSSSAGFNACSGTAGPVKAIKLRLSEEAVRQVSGVTLREQADPLLPPA